MAEVADRALFYVLVAFGAAMGLAPVYFFFGKSHQAVEYIDYTYHHLLKNVEAREAILAARIAFSNFAILLRFKYGPRAFSRFR